MIGSRSSPVPEVASDAPTPCNSRPEVPASWSTTSADARDGLGDGDKRMADAVVAEITDAGGTAIAHADSVATARRRRRARRAGARHLGPRRHRGQQRRDHRRRQLRRTGVVPTGVRDASDRNRQRAARGVAPLPRARLRARGEHHVGLGVRCRRKRRLRRRQGRGVRVQSQPRAGPREHEYQGERDHADGVHAHDRRHSPSADGRVAGEVVRAREGRRRSSRTCATRACRAPARRSRWEEEGPRTSCSHTPTGTSTSMRVPSRIATTSTRSWPTTTRSTRAASPSLLATPRSSPTPDRSRDPSRCRTSARSTSAPAYPRRVLHEAARRRGRRRGQGGAAGR